MLAKRISPPCIPSLQAVSDPARAFKTNLRLRERQRERERGRERRKGRTGAVFILSSNSSSSSIVLSHHFQAARAAYTTCLLTAWLQQAGGQIHTPTHKAEHEKSSHSSRDSQTRHGQPAGLRVLRNQHQVFAKVVEQQWVTSPLCAKGRVVVGLVGLVSLLLRFEWFLAFYLSFHLAANMIRNDLIYHCVVLSMTWRCLLLVFISTSVMHLHLWHSLLIRSFYSYWLAEVPCCLLEKKNSFLLVQVIAMQQQLIDCAVHHTFLFALMSKT